MSVPNAKGNTHTIFNQAYYHTQAHDRDQYYAAQKAEEEAEEKKALELEEEGPDDPMRLMAKVQIAAGKKVLQTTSIVPDVTIFFCLPPPTPNIMYPDAPRNLRGWAAALLANRSRQACLILNGGITVLLRFYNFPQTCTCCCSESVTFHFPTLNAVLTWTPNHSKCLSG